MDVIQRNSVMKSRSLWMTIMVMFLVTSGLVNLGLWQLNRFEQAQVRQAMFEQNEQSPMLWHSDVSLDDEGKWFRLSGMLHQDHSLLLDNQVYQGKIGFRWLIPLEVPSKKQWLLLDFGFIEAGLNLTLPKLPRIDLPAYVVGQLYQVFSNPFNEHLQGEEGYPKKIQALNVSELEYEMQQSLAPYVFRIRSFEGFDTRHYWRPTSMKPEKHLGYAVQWFALALFFNVLMLWWYRKTYVLAKST